MGKSNGNGKALTESLVGLFCFHDRNVVTIGKHREAKSQNFSAKMKEEPLKSI